MKNMFVFSGGVAAVVYTAAVWVGGYLRPDYSHQTQAISELLMAGAPNQGVLQPLFWIYNVLLLGFGVGVVRFHRRRLIQTSAAFLCVCAISGVMMLLFPQDTLGGSQTTSGAIHLVFAGLAAISTIAAIFLVGSDQRYGNPRLSIASFVAGGIVVVSGPLAAIAPTRFPSTFGVIERVTIGAFIVWLFVFSLALARTAHRQDHGHAIHPTT